MATFVDKKELGIFDQFIEFFCHKRRRYGVLPPPNQECWRFDLVEFVAEIVAPIRARYQAALGKESEGLKV